MIVRAIILVFLWAVSAQAVTTQQIIDATVNVQKGGTALQPGDLSSATNSTSITTPANSAAVKSAYDLAAGKQSPATTLAGYGITDTPSDGLLYYRKNGAWQQATIAARVAADLAEAPLTRYDVVGYSASGTCISGTDVPDPSTTAASLLVYENAVTAAGGNPEINVRWECLEATADVMFDGDPASVFSYAVSGDLTITGLPLVFDGAPAFVAVYATTGDIAVITPGALVMDGDPAFVSSNGVAGDLAMGRVFDGDPAYVAPFVVTGDVTVSAGGGITRSDDFAGTGDLSANWATGTLNQKVTRVSGKASAPGAGGALWTGDTFSADQFSEIVTVPTVGSDSQEIVLVRASGDFLGTLGLSMAGVYTYHFSLAHEDEAQDYLTLSAVINGVGSAPYSQPYMDNVTHIRLAVSGSGAGTVLKAQYRVSGGAWQTLYNQTPPDIIATGQPAIYIDSPESIEAWAGGDGAGTP
jgi:hypothetical protein